MINKIIQMANERMHICIECPVYNSTTRTCGTPLNKLNPFAQPVTLDGVTFKPCGCFLDPKTKMSFADCPAGRWPKVVDAELVEQARALVAEVKRTNVLTDANRKLLAQLDSIMKGTNTKVSSCVPCVNKIISANNNGQLFSLQNSFVYCAIKEEEFATNERDILNDLKADFEIERKSNGQRLRNVLYKLWESDKEGFLTFTKYYDHKMEQLINHFKSKLEL